jgi:hypothetical protein
VGCAKLLFDRNFLGICEFHLAGSLDLLKPTLPGDRRDDCNRNDYYLGDPRLNRAYSRAKIAAEEKLLISDLFSAIGRASPPLCSALILSNEQLLVCNSPDEFK